MVLCLSLFFFNGDGGAAAKTIRMAGRVWNRKKYRFVYIKHTHTLAFAFVVSRMFMFGACMSLDSTIGIMATVSSCYWLNLILIYDDILCGIDSNGLNSPCFSGFLMVINNKQSIRHCIGFSLIPCSFGRPFFVCFSYCVTQKKESPLCSTMQHTFFEFHYNFRCCCCS